AKEILLAMRLENFFEKDEIMEAYLNIIPYGRDASGQNIAGIEMAAQGIFGEDADDLSIPQAAFIAGLPQNPYAYTPVNPKRDVQDAQQLAAAITRRATVLNRMYKEEFISEKEYKKAKDYDITKDFAKKAPPSIEKYPAIVIELAERARKLLLQQIAKDDGYDMEERNENEALKDEYENLADRALRMNGDHIHSTIDKDMYEAMDKVVKDYPYFGPDKTIPETGDVEQEETGA